jgi:hypothetical protein
MDSDALAAALSHLAQTAAIVSLVFFIGCVVVDVITKT